ncbi:MAG: septal ring lytic transglycosylase RlpA family protein [Deltaproteobacteria bacterium]|nr:septal ring lytic transglycosylase RlpA family protein [Deltaproteobacteria bacterium]
MAILFTTPPVSLAGPGSETSAQIRPGETLTGKATVYPNQLNGHKTSTGETFHQTGHTGASNHLPLRTHVKVTNLENGKSTHVKINDRGPKLGKHKIDLSKKAAAEIGLTHKQGTAPVTINVTSTPDTSPGSVSR